MKSIKLINDPNSFVIVDDEDYILLNSFSRWFKTKDGHIKATTQVLHIHRLLFYIYKIPIPRKLVVDHIDQNALNNQKENLRLVTITENKLNSGLYKSNVSGYKGVAYSSRHKKWEALVRVYRENYSLGKFVQPEDAALACDLFWEKIGVSRFHKNVLNPKDSQKQYVWKKISKCKSKSVLNFLNGKLDFSLVYDSLTFNNLLKMDYNQRIDILKPWDLDPPSINDKYKSVNRSNVLFNGYQLVKK